MQYDPIHHILLKMQTALNNTARDLAKTAGDLASERQEHVRAQKSLDEATVSLSAVVTERDALKLEVEDLKKPPPPPPKADGLLVGSEDHL